MSAKWYSQLAPAEVKRLRQDCQRKLLWHICKLDAVGTPRVGEQQAARDTEHKCFQKSTSLADYRTRIGKKLQRLATAFQQKYGKSLEAATAEDQARRTAALAAAAQKRAEDMKVKSVVQLPAKLGSASAPIAVDADVKKAVPKPSPGAVQLTQEYRQRFQDLMAWITSRDGSKQLTDLVRLKPQYTRRVNSYVVRAKELRAQIATRSVLSAEEDKVVQHLHQLRSYIGQRNDAQLSPSKRKAQDRGEHPDRVQTAYAAMAERIWPRAYASLDAGKVEAPAEGTPGQMNITWLLSYIREALDSRIELSVSCLGSDPRVIEKPTRGAAGRRGSAPQAGPGSQGSSPVAAPVDPIMASCLASVRLGFGGIAVQLHFQPVAVKDFSRDHLVVDFRDRVVSFHLRQRRSSSAADGAKRRRLSAYQNGFMLVEFDGRSDDAGPVDQKLQVWSAVAQQQLKEWLVLGQGFDASVVRVGLRCEILARVCQWLQACLLSLDHYDDVVAMPRIPTFHSFLPILNPVSLRMQ
eukprot:scaffold94_cov254-Pinguiococcus_pyrenoidosus.AAC.10